MAIESQVGELLLERAKKIAERMFAEGLHSASVSLGEDTQAAAWLSEDPNDFLTVLAVIEIEGVQFYFGVRAKE